MYIRHFDWRLLGIVFLTIPMASCASNVQTPSAMPAFESAPRPSPTYTATALPPTMPTQNPTFPPTIPSKPTLVILAQNLASPDDLLMADGVIYISDVEDQTVKEYTPAGPLQTLISGLSEPEGMVLLPDGSLIVAEQGKNRLVRYDPTAKALTLFLALHNTTGQEGVDGIAYDSKTQTIIVPDSPNGTVLRLSLDGKTVGVVARGLARPTGAWVEADGSILVVEEDGNSLDRIQPDGSIQTLAHLPIPDDVIEDEQGNIFVNTLGDGAIHLISPATGRDTILVGGLTNPQGIALDEQGNLILTDAGHHQLDKLIFH
ncbi:MAG TPA: NHL repeat-containing protein [Anaerolineales bacterium]|nr:NHL repeat-containing protein [Anaerolineales bacterium]